MNSTVAAATKPSNTNNKIKHSTGENAMGIYGVDGNIREVELRNIDFTRKPSKNLPLKGNVFDFAPGRVDFEVPEDCGLYIGGGADVKLENINTRAWKIIHA